MSGTLKRDSAARLSRLLVLDRRLNGYGLRSDA